MILKISTLSILIFELNTENKETYLTIKNNEIKQLGQTILLQGMVSFLISFRQITQRN
jgi:hypothetical protein